MHTLTELYQNNGMQIPSNAIVTSAMKKGKGQCNMVLLYTEDDNWLGFNLCSQAEELAARLHRIMNEDEEVTAFKSQKYKLVNGIYQKWAETAPVHKGFPSKFR